MELWICVTKRQVRFEETRNQPGPPNPKKKKKKKKKKKFILAALHPN